MVTYLIQVAFNRYDPSLVISAQQKQLHICRSTRISMKKPTLIVTSSLFGLFEMEVSFLILKQC